MNAKFKVGNIILSPYKRNGVEIIIKVSMPDLRNPDKDPLKNVPYYNCIPIDSNNCVIGRWEGSIMERKDCYTCDAHIGYPDEECEDCKGAGWYMSERKGMNECVLLAENVQQYIMDRLLGNFEFHNHKNINP